MKSNHVLAKLLGLLYAVLLFSLGISPPVIAEVVQVQPEDPQQEQPQVVEVVTRPVAEALKETDVSFSAGLFPSGAGELTLVLQPGETAKLEEFDHLRRLDATGSTCYGELMEWGEAHPDVDLIYTVTLPSGESIPNSVEELDLSGFNGEETEPVGELLGYLPALRRIELGSPETGTRITTQQLDRLQELLPQAEIHYTVTLLGKELDPATESLDLSELSHEDAANAASALETLTALKEITLSAGEGGVDLEDVKLIAQAAPEAVISYPVSLYGKDFNLADTELDFNHIRMDDNGEAIRQLLPCMRACTFLDMDSCGVGNTQMAQIRDENPNVEVVWRVNFGSAYSVRTNVTKILASMPSKGGALYDDVGEVLQYCTKVRYLDLGHNDNLKDFSFIRNMPELEIVVISMTGISGLSPFADCPNLLYMEAGNTRIADLSPLTACTELKHLNIGTNINIKDISPLYDMDLKRLWIGSYTPVPAAQVEEMQQRHPNCIINTTAPSGLERDADGRAKNEGYILGWKNYQNYLTVDWNYYAAHGSFPAQRPIGWFKVIFKAFEYNKALEAYAFRWNDPLFDPHDSSVKPVNTLVIDTSFLKEDWTDPSSIVPDVLSDPPGETLYESEH